MRISDHYSYIIAIILPLHAKKVRSPPTEGVYIHGLFLDGAAWSKQEGNVVESEPKKLFVSLPVLYVSVNIKSDQVRTFQNAEHEWYDDG